MGLTRRHFLISAAVVGTAAFGPKLTLMRAKAATSYNVATIPTVCHMCPWKCSIKVRVRNGKVVKIDGLVENPSNLGKTCARGQAGLMDLYDPDRLKRPLIRTGERGEGKFREASWEEALDYAANGLKQVADKHGGPESVAFMSHNGGELFFSEYLPLAWGSPNTGKPNEGLCITPRERASSLTFGRAVGGQEPIDWEAIECIMLIGSHYGENAIVTHMAGLANARARGAKLIVVDPRVSTVAGKADHWLAIKPGTDTALLLAMAHVLVTEGLYDRAYVERWTHGFDKLQEHLRPFTPQWAAAITEIPADVIRSVTHELAAHAPRSLIVPGRHTTWYGNDTQRVRAQFIVNTLLGAVGRKGGQYFPTAPYYEGFPHPPFALEVDTGG